MNANQEISKEIKDSLLDWKKELDGLEKAYDELDAFVASCNCGMIPENEVSNFDEKKEKFKISWGSFIKKCEEFIQNSKKISLDEL
jgi:hypothetical protein